eukprot:gene533-570_t
MRNPVTVTVKVNRKVEPMEKSQEQLHEFTLTARSQVTPSSLQNLYMTCAYDARPLQLVLFLNLHIRDKVMVFVSTCACVDYFTSIFSQLHLSLRSHVEILLHQHVTGLHGKMDPKKRRAIYRRFLDQDAGVMFCTDVAARGIDIPDVDWIVQFTAPKDPAYFVHRVGRTARAGRSGGALLFVAEKEEAYIALLRNRGVPITECPPVSPPSGSAEAGRGGQTDHVHDMESDNGGRPQETDASDTVSLEHELLQAMRRVSVTDRAVLELGSTAFISFLRAYKEHQCSYIFRFNELDLAAVARCYALLKLPRIPETRTLIRLKLFEEIQDIDTSQIAYRHKEKEAARQRRLQERLCEREKEVEARPEGLGRKGGGGREKRSCHVEGGGEDGSPVRKRKKKTGRHQRILEEWDELAAEEHAYRLYKKGKIGEGDYEAALLAEEAPTEIGQGGGLGGSGDDDSSVPEGSGAGAKKSGGDMRGRKKKQGSHKGLYVRRKSRDQNSNPAHLKPRVK